MSTPAPALLWTAATSAASDRHTMETLGVPSLLLMERAALCVSHEVAAILRGRGGAVGVLVGPGNNGGDGLAVARQLRGWGIPAEAWLVTDKHNQVVAEQLALARAMGVTVHRGRPSDDASRRLWVDGLLGTGSRGAPRGAVGEAVEWLLGHEAECVAIDLPTGIDPDTGVVSGPAVRARCTVTFARSKPGLHITPGRGHAGRVVVADIGLVDPPDMDDRLALLDPVGVANTLRRLPAGSHKGQRGHLGIVGGSPGTTGAALLAGVAALRSGAGLVTVASPDPGLGSMLLAARPELMTAPLVDEPGRLLPRAQALVVGPGLTDEASQRLLARLFREDPRPALWDASALDHVPADGAMPTGPRVITPHPGEAARLLARIDPEVGWSSALVQSERLEAARRIAEATHALVVLKGEGTLIATPDGLAWVAISGGPALATAGSGDVLAGFGGALLARGAGPTTAARIAVHVHGVAGESLGDGPGPIALDVAEALPRVMSTLVEDPSHPRWPSWRRG
ncbi:MAG: NAD(P)H-hydrate dehydratase [Myxococcales bacterium]|nr:NAD(P)H-hydrate dehydratase [Myxococcales bacterium]